MSQLASQFASQFGGLGPEPAPASTAEPIPGPMSTEMVYRRAAAIALEPAPPHPASAVAVAVAVAVAGAEAEDLLRRALAAKLEATGPVSGDSGQRLLVSHTLATLVALVRETAARLRAALPGLLAGVPDADPAAIARRLDDAPIPAMPLLQRVLPLLSGDDLLALITAPPAGSTARLLALRPRLSPDDARAIAQSAATPALRALLDSPQPAIREATLDVLIAREVGHPGWSDDQPVLCPALPPHAAGVLSGLVARRMLAVLAADAHTPHAVCEALRARIQRSLSTQLAHSCVEPSGSEAIETAYRLKRVGALTEAVVLAACRRSESRLVGALLAIAANVPVSAVNRAVSLRSTKCLVSLVWRGGFSAALTLPVQSLLARLPADALLPPAEDGSFPLAVEEMRWQLEFLTRVGR